MIWLKWFVICFSVLPFCWSCNHLEISNAEVQGLHIRSNGFPNSPYRSESDECWTIHNTDNGTLRIIFHDFWTESCCDVVVLYDDVSATAACIIIELQGSSYSRHEMGYFHTSGSYLHVRFTSDSSVQKLGWQACICAGNVLCNCSWDTPHDILMDFQNVTTSVSESSLFQLLPSIVGLISGGIILFCVGIGITIGCCCAKNRRRTGHQGAPMANITTSNIPPGTYPMQRTVGYPNQSQDGTIGSPHPNSYPVHPHQMPPPAYSMAMSYPVVGPVNSTESMPTRHSTVDPDHKILGPGDSQQRVHGVDNHYVTSHNGEITMDEGKISTEL